MQRPDPVKCFLLKTGILFGTVQKIIINFCLPSNSFPNYSPYKNPFQFRKEMKNFWRGEMKRFKYKSTLQYGEFSRNFYNCNLFYRNLGTTKLVVIFLVEFIFSIIIIIIIFFIILRFFRKKLILFYYLVIL